MKKFMLFAGIALTVSSALSSAQARAADETSTEVKNAINFVTKNANASDIVALMHPGTRSVGATAVSVHDVVDQYKTKIPGAFAVKVRHSWKVDGDNDYTDLLYFFNKNGRLTSINVSTTTAIFNQPFALTGVALEALKDALIDEMRKDPNAKGFIPLVKNASAKGVAELMLQIRQN